jgi:small-conductance mechanosensitive channel
VREKGEKMTTSQPTTQRSGGRRRRLFLAIVPALLGLAVIITTIELARDGTYAFVTANRNHLVAAEIALFSVFVVEALGRIAKAYFRQFAVLPSGMSIRTIIRIVAYLIAAVAIFSILASNSALAIGVGSVTGVVIAFTAQSLTSNVLAGLLLSTSRMVRKGSELTVAGRTGRLVEIKLIYTIIDTGEEVVFIPNSVIMSNAVAYKKEILHQ